MSRELRPVRPGEVSVSGVARVYLQHCWELGAGGGVPACFVFIL